MKSQRAFSLAELAIALATTVFCLFVLLSLLVLASKMGKDSREDVLTAHVAEVVRAKLLTDSDWPVSQTQSLGYSENVHQHDVYFDLSGEEVSENEAVFRAELKFLSPNHENVHYPSPRLDPIGIHIYDARNNQLLETFHVQRAHRRCRE